MVDLLIPEQLEAVLTHRVELTVDEGGREAAAAHHLHQGRFRHASKQFGKLVVLLCEAAADEEEDE